MVKDEFDDDPVEVEGTITIRWRRLARPDPGDQEFAWGYESLPPLPDESAARLLRDIADRL